jgi:hypothetical protein
MPRKGMPGKRMSEKRTPRIKQIYKSGPSYISPMMKSQIRNILQEKYLSAGTPQSGKIIVKNKSSLTPKIREARHMVSLRFLAQNDKTFEQNWYDLAGARHEGNNARASQYAGAAAKKLDRMLRTGRIPVQHRASAKQTLSWLQQIMGGKSATRVVKK